MRRILGAENVAALVSMGARLRQRELNRRIRRDMVLSSLEGELNG